MSYAVVFEQTPHNDAADVPDLPGCVATGKPLDEAKRNIRQAVVWHLDGLREDNIPIAEPLTTIELVDV